MLLQRATNNDIAAQLALQTQTRLGLSDKLDDATKSLRDAQEELRGWKDRVRSLERETNQSSRSNTRSNADYRDQLAERNTLLQTVYQTVDKIVGTVKVSLHDRLMFNWTELSTVAAAQAASSRHEAAHQFHGVP